MDINLVKRRKNYYIVLPQHQTINMYHRRQQPPYGTSTTRKMAQSSDETIYTIQCRMCILLLSMLCILLLSYQLDIIRNTAMHYVVSIFCGHSESEWKFCLKTYHGIFHFISTKQQKNACEAIHKHDVSISKYFKLVWKDIDINSENRSYTDPHPNLDSLEKLENIWKDNKNSKKFSMDFGKNQLTTRKILIKD